MKPGDRVIITDPRAGALYGEEGVLLEIVESRARVEAKGTRAWLPLRWLAPVDEGLLELGAPLPKLETLNGGGFKESPPILGSGAPKSEEELGAPLPKVENLNTTDLISALSALCDRLQSKGTLPGWIEERKVGGKVYYRYRCHKDGGQPQQAIAPKDLASYRYRVRNGQTLNHARSLIRLLEEDF